MKTTEVFDSCADKIEEFIYAKEGRSITPARAMAELKMMKELYKALYEDYKEILNEAIKKF